MTITDVLEENCQKFGDDICLVEINPAQKETRRVTWREYELMEPNPSEHYRREISWNVFNEKANRFANLLLSRGIKKGDKVAILLMNGLEWLPIYFGILKTGALAVPLNLRKWTYWCSVRNLSAVWKILQKKSAREDSYSMSARPVLPLQKITAA